MPKGSTSIAGRAGRASRVPGNAVRGATCAADARSEARGA